MQYIICYVACLLIFLALDLAWLGGIARRFYKTQLGPLMADKLNFWAAAAFYVVYPVGIVAFAIAPTIETGAWTDAAARGALFGFIAYATYDLSNLATLRAWPLPLTFVDLAWGTTLSAVTAASALAIGRSVVGA